MSLVSEDRNGFAVEHVPDRATAEFLAAQPEETRNLILKEMTRLTESAIAQQGSAALICTREDAAFHEAGHAVYEASVGQPVTLLKIFHETVAGKRAWLGVNVTRPPWTVSPTTSPEADLDVARFLVAGWMAEFTFLAPVRRFHLASSVNEFAFCKTIINNVAIKTGIPFSALLDAQLASVGWLLKDHEPTVRAIVAALIARGSLKGDRLDRLLEPVRKAAARSIRDAGGRDHG